VGLSALIEMPNTTPMQVDDESMFSRMQEMQRLATAAPRVFRHIGLTTDADQVRLAYRLAKQREYANGGVKAYFAHSTGNMGLLDDEPQQRVWTQAARSHYDGPVLGHYEDENEYGKEMQFDPARPITHSFYQTEKAEWERHHVHLPCVVTADGETGRRRAQERWRGL
jgi:hypothetical protein